MAKWADGANKVQVKERSTLGMAMNIDEPAGQIWRWLGEMAKLDLASSSVRLSVAGGDAGI